MPVVRLLQRKYFAPFVFGSIDGLVTTFAVVSSVIGAGLSPKIILILGFANLFADGFSMGVSNYLSEKSETVERQASINRAPWKAGAVTFLAFLAVGFVPLIPFALALVTPWFTVGQFAWSVVLTGIAFASVGYAKGVVTGHNRGGAVIETLAIGSAAALIAYAVGNFLSGLV
jgi:VIT1/CCC1 family predicted Fe2+/Mn2+ transporter